MNVFVFDNKIIAPNKCGTRFLKKIFKNYEETNHYEIPNIKNCFLIIRNPFEHFKTSLYTEILGIIENNENLDKNFTLSNNIIKRYFDITLDKHRFNNGHFSSDLYRKLYFYKVKNNDCNVVELIDLSDLIKKLGFEYKYQKEDYNFSNKNYKQKDEFYEEIKTNFTAEIERIENWIKIEMIYFNNLKQNNINNFKII